MIEVDNDEFSRAWTTGAVVVDVREADEYTDAHVPGALWIPLGELANRTNEVPADGTVYVICASGNRSKQGAQILCMRGHHAVSVIGGTRAWRAAGRPVRHGLEAPASS